MSLADHASIDRARSTGRGIRCRRGRISPRSGSIGFYHCSSLPLGRWRIAKRGLDHLALRQPAPASGPVALLKEARDVTKMRFALTLGFSAQGQRSREIMLHFEHETVGNQSKSFPPIAGNFSIGSEDNNKVLQGQTSAGGAERTKTLYGECSAESLNNVKAFAYLPSAVATRVDDFRNREISLRKSITGRIDQGAGILFTSIADTSLGQNRGCGPRLTATCTSTTTASSATPLLLERGRTCRP